jgi:predicted nucleotide-binding protein
MRRDDQSWYDTMQVCLNGHQITNYAQSQPAGMRKRCDECGEQTTDHCLKCNTKIIGYHHIPGVIGFSGPEPPAHCHECGVPYPWTERRKIIGSKINASSSAQTNKIFIVHGHDDAMKESVARAVSKLGLEPIILHEKPNSGRTIIEKFEKNADVQFAIALLSPDDLAYVATDSPKNAVPRARQNVVLELGYFVGRLGRDRVLALKKEGNLEVPSDFAGVVYTSYDPAGKWQFEMVRELKAAGYDVDANLVL